MNTFPPIAKPSKITPNTDWRILQAQFGDGYEQFATDGTNSKISSFTLSWDILSLQDSKILDDFLKAQTPVNAFTWNNPDTLNVETVRFIKDSYVPTRQAVLYTNVSLQLKIAYGY